MDTHQPETILETDDAVRLPWTKPEVRRLVVALDTQMPPPKGGSFIDGGLGTHFQV